MTRSRVIMIGRREDSGMAWLARASVDAPCRMGVYDGRMFGAARFTRITRPAA
jgi:hypothetical protein